MRAVKPKGKVGVYNKKSGKDLGEIKMVGFREVESVEMDLQMEDSLFNEFVEIGRKDATPEDFFSVAFKKMLAETIEDLERKKRKNNGK